MEIWNSILNVLQNYVFPVVGTVMTTVLPIITPYVIARISAKFTGLQDTIKKRLDVIDTDLEHKVLGIGSRINNLITREDLAGVIANEVSKIVAPIFEELTVNREVLATVVDNSRIPSDVKNRLKKAQDGSKGIIENLNAIISHKDIEIATLKDEKDLLQAQIFALTQKNTVLSGEIEQSKKTIGKKKKEKAW